MSPAIHIHPRLNLMQRYHVAVTAVLLTLVIVPQFLDAFGAERANLWINLTSSSRHDIHSLPAITLLGVLFILLLLADTRLFSFITGVGPPPARTELSAVLKGLSLMRAAKRIDQRLWAAGFLPAGPPPDPAAPRIVAARPVRFWKFDSYEAPPLRIEIDLEEHADRTEVRAVMTPNKLARWMAIDSGESDYYRALLEHVVTGDSLRRIGDAGVGTYICLISAWGLALVVTGWQFCWLGPEGLIAGTFGFSLGALGLALVERIFRRNIVGADLSCALSLIMVCGAILFRGDTA